MRTVCLALALALAAPLAAQEKKAPKKPLAKPAAGKRAHSKPTPQQIREFNKLEKKEQKTGDGARTR